MNKNEFRSLLETVVLHWQQSAKAYSDYMENGKKFRYAQVLKLHNTAVLSLLTENINAMPGELKKDAEAIIDHYKIWTAKWDELKSTMNPGQDEEFVFENDHRFPKLAAQNMEAALEDLL